MRVCVCVCIHDVRASGFFRAVLVHITRARGLVILNLVHGRSLHWTSRLHSRVEMDMHRAIRTRSIDRLCPNFFRLQWNWCLANPFQQLVDTHFDAIDITAAPLAAR